MLVPKIPPPYRKHCIFFSAFALKQDLEIRPPCPMNLLHRHLSPKVSKKPTPIFRRCLCLEPSTDCVIVVSAGVNQEIFLIGIGKIRMHGISSPNAKRRTFIPVSLNRSMTALISEVIKPRSSATIGRCIKCFFKIFKKSSAGTFTHFPLTAVFSPTGISQ